MKESHIGDLKCAGSTDWIAGLTISSHDDTGLILLKEIFEESVFDKNWTELDWEESSKRANQADFRFGIESRISISWIFESFQKIFLQ